MTISAERRTFIKFLAAFPLLKPVMAGADTITERRKSRPDDLFERYAQSPCHFDVGKHERVRRLGSLVIHAKQNLRKGTTFEIRAKPFPAKDGCMVDYGRVHVSRDRMAEEWAMCWYSTNAMADLKLGCGLERDPTAGCEILMRLKA